MQKPRSDSKIANLPPLQREAVEEILLTGGAYKDARDYLAEDGVKISITSIREYFQRYLVLRKIARDNQVASEFEKVESGNLDAGTFTAIKAIAFDLATSSKPDVRAITALGNLILKNRSLDHDDRRLKLLEEQRNEAKAIAQQALDVAKDGGGLTPEIVAEMEEKLKLL